MKVGIISDIHGNLEAFHAVLADIERQGIEEIVCLGDGVGYGPEPEQVIAEILNRKIALIIGNHEMAIRDPDQLSWFNPLARLSLERTIAMLSEASREYIAQLPFSLTIRGARCVHGYPPDSVRTYLFQKTLTDIKKTFQTMSERICFVGHTHDLEIVAFDGTTVTRRSVVEGVTQLHSAYRYIINVGSVGQPRDGNNNAKYVIWDSAAERINLRYIPYDIDATIAKIRRAGLPEQHASRLR
jgi:predicted phosphodiesterase